MWIKPSTPSATSTKAPNETSFVTLPLICSPTFTRSTISCHGSFLVCLRPREMRSRSRSTSRTFTSTSSPTSTTSLGWSTCCQESSEMWMRPSMPSRSTKAPKSDVQDQAALYDLDDGSLDGALVVVGFLDAVPGPLERGPFGREDQTP